MSYFNSNDVNIDVNVIAVEIHLLSSVGDAGVSMATAGATQSARAAAMAAASIFFMVSCMRNSFPQSLSGLFLLDIESSTNPLPDQE